MTSIHFLCYIQNISHSHIIASPQIKILSNENPWAMTVIQVYFLIQQHQQVLKLVKSYSSQKEDLSPQIVFQTGAVINTHLHLSFCEILWSPRRFSQSLHPVHLWWWHGQCPSEHTLCGGSDGLETIHTRTSKYGHSFHGKTSLSSSSVLPEGSLSGLYSRAFCEMRSVSSRNSLTVLYWWRSILERTVDKSIGFLITSA